MEKDCAPSVFDFIVIVMIILIGSIKTLLSIFKKGVFKDPRTILLKRTNKELRDMLVGVKNISTLKKDQLVDKILSYS